MKLFFFFLLKNLCNTCTLVHPQYWPIFYFSAHSSCRHNITRQGNTFIQRTISFFFPSLLLPLLTIANSETELKLSKISSLFIIPHSYRRNRTFEINFQGNNRFRKSSYPAVLILFPNQLSPTSIHLIQHCF